MTMTDIYPSPSSNTFTMNPNATEFFPQSTEQRTLVSSTLKKKSKKMEQMILVVLTGAEMDAISGETCLREKCKDVVECKLEQVNETIAVGWLTFKSKQSATMALKGIQLLEYVVYAVPAGGGKRNAGSGGTPTNTKLIVKNLPSDYSMNEFNQLLDELNLMADSVSYQFDDVTGKFKGIGCIDFGKDIKLAQSAWIMLNNYEIQCGAGRRTIRVEYKKNEPKVKSKRAFDQSTEEMKQIYNQLKEYRRAVDDKSQYQALVMDDTKYTRKCAGDFKLKFQGYTETHGKQKLVIYSTGSTSRPINIKGKKKNSNTIASSSPKLSNSYEKMFHPKFSNSPSTSPPILFNGKPRRERGTGSFSSLQNDKYAKGPDGTRGFPADRGYRMT